MWHQSGSVCKRCRLFAILLIVVFSPILAILTVLVFFDIGHPFFMQTRVGRYQAKFTLIKFRTMHVGTASMATHFVDPASVTPFGGFLRKTKLDELPQLLNVLRGEMSLVGPRPSLPCQSELIEFRQQRNVFSVRPGITGMAQIKGVDMSSPKLLAEVDAQMISEISVFNYFKYIYLTICGRGYGDRVKN